MNDFRIDDRRVRALTGKGIGAESEGGDEVIGRRFGSDLPDLEDRDRSTLALVRDLVELEVSLFYAQPRRGG